MRHVLNFALHTFKIGQKAMSKTLIWYWQRYGWRTSEVSYRIIKSSRLQPFKELEHVFLIKILVLIVPLMSKSGQWRIYIPQFGDREGSGSDEMVTCQAFLWYLVTISGLEICNWSKGIWYHKKKSSTIQIGTNCWFIRIRIRFKTRCQTSGKLKGV